MKRCFAALALICALALGYDFNSQFGVPVRAEVEYALRGNSEKSWNYDKILDLKGAWKLPRCS